MDKGSKKNRNKVAKFVLLALKVGISFGLLATLFWWIDTEKLKQQYSDLKWGWLVLGVMLLQMQCALSSLKWRIILRADGESIGFRFLWKTYLIGNFLSLFLPSSFGGDLYRTWALNNGGAKMSKSAASVLFDRLSGLFALVTIGVVGFVLLIGIHKVLPIIIGYVFFLVLFLVLTSDSFLARLPEIRSKYLGFPFRVLRSFNLYRRSRGKLVAVVLISLAFQFGIVLIVSCYAKALKVSPNEVSFREMVAIVPPIYITEILPISINGIGVRDGAFVFFFEKVGGLAEQGLALSLLIIAVRYLNGLVGGFLLLCSLLGVRIAPSPQSTAALEVTGLRETK